MTARTIVVDHGRPGPPGPPGPAGPPGTAVGTETVFAVPAATWTVTHTMTRHPNVTILVGGVEWETDVAFSPGQVVVTFASPQTGSVVLT